MHEIGQGRNDTEMSQKHGYENTRWIPRHKAK